MRTTKENGITLIALVITIIVMLILVAVTITMAVNGGLFEYASNAGKQTNEAVANEQLLASGKVEIDGKWYNNIDDFLNNKPLVMLPEGIKVGDYVNYTPTAGTYTVASGENGSGDFSNQSFSTEDLDWRILSIDEETGEVELVSAKHTTSKLGLRGVDGYNHGVDILNDMCVDLYSKENAKGERVATARSITIEDINAKSIYDPKKDPNYSSVYGTEFRYSSNYSHKNYRKYPNIYAYEQGFYVGGVKQEGGIAGSIGLGDGVTDATSGITTYSTVTGYSDDWDSTSGATKKDVSVTHTFYYYYFEDYSDSSLGMNRAPYGFFATGSDYWLASRAVNCTSSQAEFYVLNNRTIPTINGGCLYSSNGSGRLLTYSVRPVVELGTGAQFSEAGSFNEYYVIWDVQF